MPGNKIGLLNVHHRVKLLYGEGLHIRRLEPNTEIAFMYLMCTRPQPRYIIALTRSEVVKVIIVEDEFRPNRN